MENIIYLSTLLSFTLLGAFLAMIYRLHSAEKSLKESQDKLNEKIIEFDKVTRDASLANNSMGKLLQDQQEMISQLDERMSMLQGTTGINKGAKQWQPNHPQ